MLAATRLKMNADLEQLSKMEGLDDSDDEGEFSDSDNESAYNLTGK